MTKEDIFLVIRPVMEHCGCDKDASAAAEAILPIITELERKLRNISKNPDTPLLIKQYALGYLDGQGFKP